MKLEIDDTLGKIILHMAEVKKITLTEALDAAISFTILVSFLPQEQQETIMQWVENYKHTSKSN